MDNKKEKTRETKSEEIENTGRTEDELEFERQMKVAERVMSENYELLRKLAKS